MTDPNATAPTAPDEPLAADAADSETPNQESADDHQRELEESRDKYLRLAAEFENFRRRSSKERQEAGWRAQGELVRSLLDVFDDLKRFAELDASTVDSKTVVDGVTMVEKKLFKVLESVGVESIDPTGNPFDPAFHEAMTTTPAASAEEDGQVALCFQPGYVINGLVLRPARVVVKQWTNS